MMKYLLRIISITALLIGANAVSAYPDHKTWDFKVFMDDREIGIHTFRIFSDKQRTFVTTSAHFDVNVLFVSLYDYMHDNTEIWQGACLESLQSQTNDNGELQFVKAERNGSKMVIVTPQGTSEINGCIKSFAYWDRSFLESKTLLNSQTGELLHVQVIDLGFEDITVRSRITRAQRYQIETEKFRIDLWYSENNEWLALNSVTSEGYMLRYVMQ